MTNLNDIYESLREDPERYNALTRLYDERLPLYRRAVEETQRAVAEIRKKYGKNAKLRIAYVDGRVKSLHSVVRKGLGRGIDATNLLDVLPDTVGVRVVVNNIKDVEPLIEELGCHPRLTVHSREDHDDGTGYRAVHLDVSVRWADDEPGERSSRCEIQVRTLLQDAWAIMSHHDFYKNTASLPVLARPISARLSQYLEATDALADDLRTAIEAVVQPPNDLSEDAPLDREGIAFLYYSVFGEKPQEYGVEYLARKASELGISTVGDARRGLNETTLRRLSELHRKEFWFRLDPVEGFEYGLHWVVRGEKAFSDFRTKLKADRAEIEAQARGEILAELPETYEEFLEELQKGLVSAAVLKELGALRECIRCGADILDEYALAEAVAEHYECDVDDGDILGALSEYAEFQEDPQCHGFCSYCGHQMSKDD